MHPQLFHTPYFRILRRGFAGRYFERVFLKRRWRDATTIAISAMIIANRNTSGRTSECSCVFDGMTETDGEGDSEATATGCAVVPGLAVAVGDRVGACVGDGVDVGDTEGIGDAEGPGTDTTPPAEGTAGAGVDTGTGVGVASFIVAVKDAMNALTFVLP